jgi:DNA repair exonuclease SbcCD nuclease subunit
MKRVLALGDSHFDARSRFEECVRIHGWIADYVERERIDLVVHAGDVYERESGIPERDAVAAWALRIAAQCPLLIVRGNHDKLGDLALLEELRTTHPIVVQETAGVHRLAGLTVAALAWPRRAAMEESWRARTGRSPTPDEVSTIAREGLRFVLSAFAARSPALLVSHAMVRGALTSTGQPLVGCDMEVGLDDLRACGAPVVLGHIHKPQAWGQLEGLLNGGVWYTGSPRRTAFGETETKSVLLMTFDDAEQLVSVERVPTPCTGMELLELEHDATLGFAALAELDPEAVIGAEVRFRYVVDADRRVEARKQAEAAAADLMRAGAVDVKVEERVRPASTARAPEVASKTTLDAKLRALWAARNEEIDAGRERSLLRLVHELEQEAA